MRFQFGFIWENVLKYHHQLSKFCVNKSNPIKGRNWFLGKYSIWTIHGMFLKSDRKRGGRKLVTEVEWVEFTISNKNDETDGFLLFARFYLFIGMVVSVVLNTVSITSY